MGTGKAADKPKPGKGKQDWSAHMWNGCTFSAWLRMLAKGRFGIDWAHLYLFFVITTVAAFNTVLKWAQNILYGRRIRNTPIEQPPVFILGHWRTGTTLLHELMILDERHAYPTTYQCLCPNHFVLTEGWLSRCLWWMLPRRRPMDNMKTGFKKPQEEEFAFCMMGIPSPYLDIAFPNRRPLYPEYLDLENVPPRALARWKNGLLRFLQGVTFKANRRLILKSPPHTCRIPVLQQMFPGALFIHIVRDPYVVFPSTVNLWKALYKTQGLHEPDFTGLEDQVFETGLKIHERLERTRGLVDPARFYELRYEDLVADPVGQMEAIYDHFRLGGFDKMLPWLQQYLKAASNYKTNEWNLTPEQEAEVTRRWGVIIDRHGYPRRRSDNPDDAHRQHNNSGRIACG